MPEQPPKSEPYIDKDAVARQQEAEVRETAASGDLETAREQCRHIERSYNRARAYAALIEAGDTDIVDEAETYAHNLPEPFGRYTALRDLYLAGHTKILAATREAAAHLKDPFSRAEALLQLCEAGDPESLEPAATAVGEFSAQSKRETIRESMQERLARLPDQLAN